MRYEQCAHAHVCRETMHAANTTPIRVLMPEMTRDAAMPR